MVFNSWEFAFFAALLFPLYFLLPHKGQNRLLLVGSYVFYGSWDWRFLGLLFFTTCVDYSLAMKLERVAEERRKRVMLVSVVMNLTVLGFFKYFNFFVDSAASLLTHVGLQVHPRVLNIILPAGISFYTFQEMAYVIDVYRRRLSPCRDFWDFALFVSYFPHLVAGPIQLPGVLLPQIAKARSVTYEKLTSGAILVLIGLARKILIADAIAPHVDAAFTNPAKASSLTLLSGVYLFALQIYGDFSGYTDIARGVSRMLGIELLKNFDRPYFSTNITEFWRRWHISLSTWLRDYLYISLGGNRGPDWFVYRNLMLTMLLGGLWHGASWTFVIWGGLHGLALSVHKLWLGGHRPPERAPFVTAADKIKAIGSGLATFAFVCFAWIFFRAHTFSDAFAMIKGIAALHGPFSVRALGVPAGVTALLLFIDLPQALKRQDEALLRWPWVLRGLTYAVLVVAMVLKSGKNVPFIYFQF
jgi:alginate O-acetyltransferase complex protein AlgI